MRYLKEIDKVKTLAANDWDPKAVELMVKNFEYNCIENKKYETHAMDAVTLMH